MSDAIVLGFWRQVFRMYAHIPGFYIIGHACVRMVYWKHALQKGSLSADRTESRLVIPSDSL